MYILHTCITKNQKTSLPRETVAQNGLRHLKIGGQHPGGPIHGGDGHGVRIFKGVSHPGNGEFDGIHGMRPVCGCIL